MKRFAWLGLASLVVLVLPQWAMAQPSRQMPGTRPYLPGSPTNFPAPLNPRTQVVSNVGTQSTDFYGKKGYPSQLGDSSTASATGGASASGTTGSISGGGVSGSISGGVSGGLTGGAGGSSGSILGGLGNLGGGGAGGGNAGITGGGFSGVSPKGFGFGGVPASEFAPLHWPSK